MSQRVQVAGLEPSTPQSPTLYAIQIRGVDAEGNPGPWSREFVFQSLDEIPPDIEDIIDTEIIDVEANDILLYTGTAWVGSGILFDGTFIRSDGSVSFTNTVSGVAPTSANHLATKKYVDDNTVSTEGFVKADGTVPFTGTVSGVTPTLDAHLATKKYVDDNTVSTEGLVKADGTVPFTGTVSGVTPTLDAHLATKKYVDDNTVSTEGFVKADGTVPFTGTVSGVTPTLDAHLATKKYVDDKFLGQSALSPSFGPVEIDFAASDYFTHTVDGDVVYDSVNLSPARSVLVKITASEDCSIDFPGWNFIGEQYYDGESPTLLSGQVALLAIHSFGSTDSDCVARLDIAI